MLVTTDRRICNAPAEGSCLFRFSFSGPNNILRSISQTLPNPTWAGVGDMLTISGQFMGDTLTNSARVYLRIFYTDGTNNRAFLPTPSGSFSYTTVTRTLIVENKPVSHIVVSVEVPSSTSGILRVDDLRLTHTDSTLLPTPTPSPTPDPNPCDASANVPGLGWMLFSVGTLDGGRSIFAARPEDTSLLRMTCAGDILW
jgi:hypothetical protein